MQAVVTVVAVVEEEVVAVEEEVAAVAVAAAVAAAAVTMTMTMMMMTVHLPSDQVHSVAVEPDEGFSTIKKWNSNWPKSCKINARWLRDDEL